MNLSNMGISQLKRLLDEAGVTKSHKNEIVRKYKERIYKMEKGDYEKEE